jgi:hypothetical protein
MHTIMIIAAGFVLLIVSLLVARAIGGEDKTTLAAAAKWFIPVWLAASLVNMWVGVSQAGYTVMQEAPILLVVFGVPAIVALILWRRFALA